jgi:putative transposase
MSRLRRYYSKGNIYFITAVTHQRQNLLIKYVGRFKDSMNKYRDELGVAYIAHVIMPDHIHMIIDPKNNDLSHVLNKIKLSFSKKVRHLFGWTGGHIWQSRFWDHMIRDQNDLNKHIDYIHYNPVKHGFAGSPFNWMESSIHDYYREGYYSRDWGSSATVILDGDYGE